MVEHLVAQMVVMSADSMVDELVAEMGEKKGSTWE